jgi:hypothetical protein
MRHFIGMATPYDGMTIGYETDILLFWRSRRDEHLAMEECIAVP